MKNKSKDLLESFDDEIEKGYTQYYFTVTGGFHVKNTWKPAFDCNNEICGFEKSDGTIIDLAVCLLMQNDKGERVIFSDKQLHKIGFESLEYDTANFVETHEAETHK